MKKRLAMLVALAVTAAVVAQAVINFKAGQSARILWDPPETNADGTPCTDLAGFMVALSAAEVDLRVGGEPLSVAPIEDAAITETALLPLMGENAGGDYRVWVLAVDEAGNESEWSDPLGITYDPLKPGKPIQIRVEK